MADQGIKKTRIKKENLPPLDVGQNGYVFRYRVISEDKNRLSHWSPIISLDPEYSYTSGDISHTKSGSISIIVWDSVVVSKNSITIDNGQIYDMWIKWDKSDGGDWLYKGRLNSTTISLITPSDYSIGGILQGDTPNKLSVEIFLPGYPATRDITTLRVYQGGPWTV
jgi:hypothetical protein